MKLGKILKSFNALLCSSLLGVELLSGKAIAQTPRPYVVFVNGYQNCCASGMNDLKNRLLNQMNAEIRYVPYSNFDNNGSSGNTSTDARFLRDGADFINNQLDKNRPLILIGHSFGGDSVLKILPRINRRVQFVGVIDPVRTGGFRASLKALTVPSNVDYFFNRWQNNEPFPNDYPVNGSISCNAKIKCDQDSQFAHTGTNGKPRREKCGLLETCSTKQVRTGHQTLPTDDYIQKIIGDIIQQQLASFRPPSITEVSPNPTTGGLPSTFKLKPDKLPLFQLPPGTDQGYSSLPRAFADVNGDGLVDYCRFVGNPSKIACLLRISSSEWAKQSDFKSIEGIDQGYPDRPRVFRDADGDGKADYCRFVGNAPDIFEACNRATASGFVWNMFVPSSSSLPLFQLPPGTDQGYSSLPRAFVDVNGDGLVDYCRFVGNPSKIACLLRISSSEWAKQSDFKSIEGIDQGYPNLPRAFKDADGDGRADYCRFLGNAPDIFEACNRATDSGFVWNMFVP